MGVIINKDANGNIEPRVLEANESIEINKQTGERTLIVGPKSVIPVPDWKEELAKFRGTLGNK